MEKYFIIFLYICFYKINFYFCKIRKWLIYIEFYFFYIKVLFENSDICYREYRRLLDIRENKIR